MADAAAKGWVPDSAPGLYQMDAEGLLTEAEAYEVRGVIELIVDRVRKDEISDHYANLIINKLAEEMADRLAARLEGETT